MKILVPAMVLAVALAWPAAGEAQSKKSKARSAQTTQQKYVPRRAKAAVRSGSPCAGHAWWGCTGWDPDAGIRDMLARDVGGDD